MSINLFYPSSFLPHKNHKFLKNSKIINFLEENNINILLTIDKIDINIYFEKYTTNSDNISDLNNKIPELNKKIIEYLMKIIRKTIISSVADSLTIEVSN